MSITVVDDGNRPALGVIDDVRILRHEQTTGPGAARNTGWRDALTRHRLDDDDVVVFVDAGVAIRGTTLFADLAGHLDRSVGGSGRSSSDHDAGPVGDRPIRGAPLPPRPRRPTFSGRTAGADHLRPDGMSRGAGRVPACERRLRRESALRRGRGTRLAVERDEQRSIRPDTRCAPLCATNRGGVRRTTFPLRLGGRPPGPAPSGGKRAMADFSSRTRRCDDDVARPPLPWFRGGNRPGEEAGRAAERDRDAAPDGDPVARCRSGMGDAFLRREHVAQLAHGIACAGVSGTLQSAGPLVDPRRVGSTPEDDD